MKTLILKKCIELNINLFYCNLFRYRILIRVFQNGKKFANIEVVMISTFNKYSSKEKNCKSVKDTVRCNFEDKFWKIF
jgi:hypothetical protein